MLREDEILKFIQTDGESKLKRDARVGLDYYEGNHEILNYRLYYFNAEGELVEDKTRSNIKISHPFFTELVDQEAQYMLSGKEGFIRSDLPELQTYLNEYFNENDDFLSELYEVLTGAISKGFDYMYVFKDTDDRLSFMWADCMNVVEVEAKDASDGEDHIIYSYIEKFNRDNKPVKRIQVWDSAQTYYYSSVGDGKIELDPSTEERPNPRPHVIFTKSDSDPQYYCEPLGFIPFFRLDNCKKRFSALKPIKAIIDDYDLMSCGLSNNLQDASEYLVVVKGFQGDNLEELIQNVRTKKHIGVNGEDGGDVEYRTVDVPYEARKVKLELDEKNIYRFGMGFNSAQLGDGNITNVVIKSRYTLLDLKCNKLEYRLRQFLRKLIGIVLKEINAQHDTDYQQKDIYFKFEREVMTNASDNAQIRLTEAQTQQALVNLFLSLEDVLGADLVLENICDVLDLDYSQVKDKIQNGDADAGLEQLISALNSA